MSGIDDVRKRYALAVELERFLLRKAMQAQIEATAAGQKATNLARELKTLQESK